MVNLNLLRDRPIGSRIALVWFSRRQDHAAVQPELQGASVPHWPAAPQHTRRPQACAGAGSPGSQSSSLMTDPAGGQGPTAASAGQSGSAGTDGGAPAAASDAVVAQAPGVHDLAASLPDELDIEGCAPTFCLPGATRWRRCLPACSVGVAGVTRQSAAGGAHRWRRRRRLETGGNPSCS